MRGARNRNRSEIVRLISSSSNSIIYRRVFSRSSSLDRLLSSIDSNDHAMAQHNKKTIPECDGFGFRARNRPAQTTATHTHYTHATTGVPSFRRACTGHSIPALMAFCFTGRSPSPLCCWCFISTASQTGHFIVLSLRSLRSSHCNYGSRSPSAAQSIGVHKFPHCLKIQINLLLDCATAQKRTQSPWASDSMHTSASGTKLSFLFMEKKWAQPKHIEILKCYSRINMIWIITSYQLVNRYITSALSAGITSWFEYALAGGPSTPTKANSVRLPHQTTKS